MTPAELEQAVGALLAGVVRRRGRPRDGKQRAEPIHNAVASVIGEGHSRRAAVQSVARSMGLTERHVWRSVRTYEDWVYGPDPDLLREWMFEQEAEALLWEEAA